MNLKKRSMWLTGAAAACIAVLLFVVPPRPARSDTQKFLQSEGYLVGTNKAITSYITAIECLKQNGITEENKRELSHAQLFSDKVLPHVLEHVRGGVRQKKIGMPRMPYYVGTVEVDGCRISDRDLYLLAFYLRSLLDSEYPVDKKESALMCLAFGVQLSEYRSHDVLYSNAIACKWKALQMLRDLNRDNGNEEKAQAISVMFQDVERQFQEFREKQKKQ